MRETKKTKTLPFSEIRALSSRIKDLERDRERLEKANKALKRDRDFARGLVQTIHAAIVVLDQKARIVQINPFMEQLTEYSLKEVKGKDWFATFIPKKEQARMREIFRKSLEDAWLHSEVCSILQKSGKILRIEWHHITLRNEKGKIAGIVCTGYDVTEQRNAEQSLKESEEKYRLLVEMSPYSITIFQDKKLVFANTATLRMFGYESADRLVGRSMMIPVADREKPRLTRYIEDRLQGKPGVPEHYESVFKRTNGEEFPAEVFVKMIRYRGKPAEQVIVVDISERKEAEKTLSVSELRLRSVLTAMVDLVFVFDREGRFIFYNAPEKLLLISPEEFLGKKYSEVMPPAMHEPFMAAFQKNKKGEPAEYEYQMELKGEVHWFSAKISPILEDREFSGSVAVIRDITNYKKMN